MMKGGMTAAYKIYRDQRGEWRWKLKSSNGRILADSGEGYKTEGGVLRAIDRFKKIAEDAPVIFKK